MDGTPGVLEGLRSGGFTLGRGVEQVQKASPEELAQVEVAGKGQRQDGCLEVSQSCGRMLNPCLGLDDRSCRERLSGISCSLTLSSNIYSCAGHHIPLPTAPNPPNIGWRLHPRPFLWKRV